MQCICVTKLILKIKDKNSSKCSFVFNFSLFGLYLNSPSFIHSNSIRSQLILMHKQGQLYAYKPLASMLVGMFAGLGDFFLFMVSRSVPEQRFYHLFLLFLRSQA